jgi:hypothetical protein
MLVKFDGCADERRSRAERAAATSGCGIEASEAPSRPLRRRYRTDCGVRQAEDQSDGMMRTGLRGIPSVDKLAHALGDTGLPHPTVVATIRRELAGLRKHGTIPSFEQILSHLHSALGILRASRIQPVINGTGILIHTNFGRVPLGPAVVGVNLNYRVDLGMHLLDLITGGDGRLTLGAEGTLTAGFGGHTGGNPSLDVKSLFLGAACTSPSKMCRDLSLGFTDWSVGSTSDLRKPQL